MIVEPPLLTGAVKLTTAELFPATADTPVGAPGTVTGVTPADAVDSTLLPTVLVACTVNVYAVPFVRPVTVQGLAEHDTDPPGEPVTVNAVIVEPPLLTGGVKLTTAELFPATADTPVGGPGTVIGVTAADGVDSVLLPTVLVACTVNVYKVPFVRPVTVHGLAEHATLPPDDPVTV